jgi:hypothetical protein
MAFNISYKESPEDSRFYVPTDSGIINVVDAMAWTDSPQLSRFDVPRMILNEFQQSTGQLIASILYFSRIIENLGPVDAVIAPSKKSDAADVYKNKYFGYPTGFRYILPYFNGSNINRTTGYTGDDNPFAPINSVLKQLKFGSRKKVGSRNIGTKIDSFLNFGAKDIDKFMAGKINFEFPQTWTNTDSETYDTTFDLFNTKKYEDVVNNRKFCHLISYQNTPSRRNFAIIDPPVIYSMSIPGIVDLPACYIPSLNIKNLGNTRTMMIEGVNRIIPEAYRISITFKSLLMPTRNIMLGTESGKTVEAISDGKEADAKIQKALDGLKNLINPKNKAIVVPEVTPPAPRYNEEPNKDYQGQNWMLFPRT